MATYQFPDPQFSTRDRIATALQAEIITGRYAPGQRLVERELSERFRVSSIPVREALQVLEAQGLLVKQPNRGCSVVKLSPQEVEQACELRAALEPRMAEWAACRMTDAGARQLEAAALQLKRAAKAHDRAAFYAADIEFHRAFWQVSGNQYAARMLDSVMVALFVSGLRIAGGIDFVQEYAKHERLLRALLDGRPSDASLILTSIAGDFRVKVWGNNSTDG